MSRKPAPVAAPPPSLPSPRPPAPPPRRLTPRCRPQRPAATLRADESVAATFAGYGLRHWRRWSAWHCSTRSRPQPRGRQLALRLAGSADAAQGLLGAAAQLHPWRRYVEVVMAQQRRQQQGQGHVQDVVPRHALTASPPSLPGLKQRFDFSPHF